MNIKLNKKSKSVIAIYAIILVIYVLSFLIIPFNKIAASWISFAFTIIAIASSLLVFNVAFNEKETIVSKIYGYPIFKVGAVYALAQIVCGIIICAISAFVYVPYWIALLLSVILLGAALIGVIITENTREIVEEIENEVKSKTFFIDSLIVDAEILVSRAKSENVKAECKKVYEAIRYSDPVSNDALASAERDITLKFSKFSEAVISEDSVTVATLADEIIILLGDRNKKCRLLK